MKKKNCNEVLIKFQTVYFHVIWYYGHIREYLKAKDQLKHIYLLQATS